MGQSPSSDSYNSIGKGVPFYQGSGDFTEKYVKTRLFCTMPTRMAQSGDVLLSVRAPVGAVNLTEKDCCIGRGLSAIRSKMSIDYNEYFYYAFRVMEHELCSLGYGSTVSAINKKQLFDVQIPDAPLPDQIRFIQFARESDKSKLLFSTAFSLVGVKMHLHFKRALSFEI